MWKHSSAHTGTLETAWLLYVCVQGCKHSTLNPLTAEVAKSFCPPTNLVVIVLMYVTAAHEGHSVILFCLQ